MPRLAPAGLLAVVFALPALAADPAAAPPAPAPSPAQDHVKYVPKYEDPLLKEMEAADAKRDEAEEAATAKIRADRKAAKEAEKAARTTLRFDMSKLVKPAGPQAFKQAFHFPPQAQYLTNTCWSFSTTSFYESEIARLTGRKVKLSEVYTVYWEWVEKLRGFVRTRGDQPVAEGSESNALPRIWKQYGIVPLSAYPGTKAADGRHDHARLAQRMESFARWIKENDLWDEDLVATMTRAILDREIGAPPASFEFEGKTYTPKSFLDDATKLKLDDYVEMVSTLADPFYTFTEYKYPDNWWRSKEYYNVPLDEWYAALKRALSAGYTVAVGGDVSEPGINGFEDAAIVPSFDVPQELIGQDARELRINNGTTDDDHGLHAVGIAQAGGHDWILIKDSGRSARWGKFEGYYFYRDDYVKLKMLGFTVHKDVVKDLLAKQAR